MNRNEEALPVLRMALAVAPKDSQFLVQIYQELAFCYGALHQVGQAIRMLDKTTKLDCDHVDILVVKGHILLQNDKIAEAEECFKQAILQSNNAPNVLLRTIVKYPIEAAAIEIRMPATKALCINCVCKVSRQVGS